MQNSQLILRGTRYIQVLSFHDLSLNFPSPTPNNSHHLIRFPIVISLFQLLKKCKYQSCIKLNDLNYFLCNIASDHFYKAYQINQFKSLSLIQIIQLICSFTLKSIQIIQIIQFSRLRSFHSIQIQSLQFNSNHSIQINSNHSIQFNSNQFNSIQIKSIQIIQFNSIKIIQLKSFN